MYWIKMIMWTVASTPLALLFDGRLWQWFPPWTGVGSTTRAGTVSLVLLAFAGRYADLLSTEIALCMPFLAESAPSLGPSPSIHTLRRVVLSQILVIFILSMITLKVQSMVGVLRMILLIVSLVSFAAAVSNTILVLAASTQTVSHADRMLERERERLVHEATSDGILRCIGQLGRALRQVERRTARRYSELLDDNLKETIESFGVKLPLFSQWDRDPERIRHVLRQLHERFQEECAHAQRREPLASIFPRPSQFLSMFPDSPAQDPASSASLMAQGMLQFGTFLGNILAVPASAFLVALGCQLLPSSAADEGALLIVLMFLWYFCRGRA